MSGSAHPRPRSRLDEGREVYELALGVADRLDDAGMDLWAAGVRACLDAEGTTERQRHLAAELIRLSHTSVARRAALVADIRRALSRLELGLGDLDVPEQPLYDAMRGLAEHLELDGGRRWLIRLRTVLEDHERAADARLRRLAVLLDRMVPGTPGMPEGAAERVRAVRERLSRYRDAERAAAYLAFAVRAPQPSRRLAADGGHADPVERG